MMTSSVQCSNVTFSSASAAYFSNETLAKHNIIETTNLEIEGGEMIGIIGPNGGGKTTFLHLIVGLLKPSSGSINVNSRAGKTTIGFVPQKARIDPLFPCTLENFVLMGCVDKISWLKGYTRADKEEMQHLLGLVGLSQSRKKQFAQLSGGQAQRALLARALMGSPSLLVLDEPTASLDPAATERIYSILRKYKKKTTIIIVTHEIPGILNDVDKIFLCKKTITQVESKALCEHLPMGLFHTPETCCMPAPNTER